MKKLVLLIGILVASIFPVMAQEDACFQKGGTWDAEQEKCVLQGGLEININYPLAAAENEFVAQTVDTFIEQQKTQFLQFFAEGGFYPGVPAPWGLWIDYEEFQFSESVISLKFIISDYTGGAHPNTYFQTYTFDLTQETVIGFEDLFLEGSNPLAVLAPLAQQQLMETMGEFADTQWITEGTGENPANYQSFVLTESSLILIFPPYQVAPYAAGPQQVEIPLANLSAILKPNFVK